MAGQIRESKTVLTAEDRTGGAFASMQKNIAGVEQQAMKMQAMFAGLAGGAIVGGFAAMIKGAVDAMAAMKDSAQEAGLMVTQLQRFEAPARLAGMSLQEVSGAMQKLSRSLVESKDPASNAALALKSFGLSAADLKGLSLDQQFEKLAIASEKYAGSAEKNAALMELTGKSGASLQKLYAEMAAAGTLQATVTNEQAEAADQLNDQIETLKINSDKFWRGLANEAVPILNDVLKAFINTRKEAGLLDGAFAALDATWDAMKGSAAEQLERINAQIKQAEENNAKRTTWFGIESGRAYDMNDLLARRAALEKRIFDQELEAQNKRALAGLAGKGGKAVVEYDPAAAAAAEKLRTAAIRATEEALRDYVKAAMDALKMDEDIERELAKLQDKRTDAILSMEKIIAQIEFETSIMGLSNDEREKAIALRALETSGIDKQDVAYKALGDRLRAALDAQKAVRDEQEKFRATMQIWDDMATSAGNFFGDLVVNGKSAFDNLKQSLKSFVADLIALFAKKWVLNMVGNATGNADILKLAGSTGQGTFAGTGLGGTLGMLATVAAAGSALGSFGAKSLGAGQRGQQVGGITGALGGGLIGAIIGKFTDPSGPADRSAMFGGRAGGNIPRSGSSAFGQFGLFDDKWFGDAMNAQLRAFIDGISKNDNSIAGYLKGDELERVKAALTGAKSYGFGKEGEDFTGTLGQIFTDRMNAIFTAIDPALAKMLEGFTGTADEMSAFAFSLLDVRAALGSAEVQGLLGRIPELTIEGLTKIQAAGESLSDTFQRVVGEFLTAQNNLNAAIGSRNPQFARDLVLSQRNGLAAQFATLVGRDFGDALLAQMALQPETFTNLNTAGMNLLANFLGLQSSLEQLDAQLAGSGTSAVVNFTNALVTSTSAITDARASLADYLNGSLLSDNSPLNPMARYEEAKRQYQANLGLAQLDDVDAISNFGRYREAFLDASRAIFASSGQYNTDFFGSFNEGANLPNSGVRPYTAADADRIAERSLAKMDVQVEKTAQVTQAVIALAGAVIANASQNTAETKAVLDDQLAALNKIANTGGVLASSGALP